MSAWMHVWRIRICMQVVIFQRNIYLRVRVCCSHTLQAINIILFVHKSLEPPIGGQSTLFNRAAIVLHGWMQCDLTPTAHRNYEIFWTHTLSLLLLWSCDSRCPGVQAGVVATGLKVVDTNMGNKGDLKIFECNGDRLMNCCGCIERVEICCAWSSCLRFMMYLYNQVARSHVVVHDLSVIIILRRGWYMLQFPLE